MKVDGVIFDMDGLMLDTETLGLEIFRKVIAELGFDPLDEVYLRTVGRNWADTRDLFAEALGATFPFDEMRERWRRYNSDHLSQFGAPYKAGLIALLNGIQELGLPTAVATSTSRQSALTLLAKVDLLHRFNAVVGGNEVQNGKPHPEIFLLAAARLNVAPQHCIVFEDSAPGIRGAAAAGMRPILVPDLIPPTPAILELAHRVCRSLDEACDLFQE
jgi:HAD superfamily hydrolase (TIGR01509 family)